MSGLGLRWADLCAQGQMRQEEPPLLPFLTLAVRSTLPALGQPHDVKSPRVFCLALPPLRVCGHETVTVLPCTFRSPFLSQPVEYSLTGQGLLQIYSTVGSALARHSP